MKTEVVFWTGSGNTQIMADAIFEALEDAGCEANINSVSDVTAEDVKDADFLFLGCPSMSGENVEEYEFRPFFDDLKPYLKGKAVVMFGSYDWGDGEWMATWIEEMEEIEADVRKTIIFQWEPTDEQLIEANEIVTELVKSM